MAAKRRTTVPVDFRDLWTADVTLKFTVLGGHAEFASRDSVMFRQLQCTDAEGVSRNDYIVIDQQGKTSMVYAQEESMYGSQNRETGV